MGEWCAELSPLKDQQSQALKVLLGLGPMRREVFITNLTDKHINGKAGVLVRTREKTPKSTVVPLPF